MTGCKFDRARHLVTDQHGNRLYLFHGNQEEHQIRGMVFDKTEVRGSIQTERMFAMWETLKVQTRPRR